MGDMPNIDIFLYLMIAAFLVLRLRSVLGRRDGNDGSGHRDPFSQRQSTDKIADKKGHNDDNVIPLPDNKHVDTDPANEITNDTGSLDDVVAEVANDPLSQGVRDIQKADPSFHTDEFISGAQVAFEMILGSFAEGDSEALKPLLDPDVYANFEQAIRSRDDAGEELEYTLIGIKSVEAVEAYMDNSYANVTIKFISEQVNALKDKDGNVVDGDPDKIIDVTDFWTFARNTRSQDPNWILAATRSLD
ncbi:MAG: Tim44/TimA family putative adaptor protein [Rhodospirillales bacterium]|jgi:predicted lipid-binding transport protein (Tim44 family)